MTRSARLRFVISNKCERSTDLLHSLKYKKREYILPYYVYITTNASKSTLYIGITNDLPSRILEHGLNAGKAKSFAGKYHCFRVVYYEEYKYVNDAILREKEIKKWRRKKKEALIKSTNPELRFLNQELGLYPFGDYADEENLKFRRDNW